MGCNSCGKRSATRRARSSGNIMNEFKYLNDRQIRARLEVYKRKYCKDCKKRYECNYEMYVKCKKDK